NRFKEAAERYRRAVELSGGGSYMPELASALFKSGEREEGLRTLETALDYAAQRDQALSVLGDVVADTLDMRQALLQVRAAVERSAHGLQWSTWARLLASAGLHDAAISAF